MDLAGNYLTMYVHKVWSPWHPTSIPTLIILPGEPSWPIKFSSFNKLFFSLKKSFLKIRYLHSPAAREKLDFVSWEIQYLRNTWFSFHIQVFVHFGSIETKDSLSFFGLPKSELQPFFRRIYPSLIVVVFLGSSLFVVLLAFALCFM